jgi:hypothetical protein
VKAHHLKQQLAALVGVGVGGDDLAAAVARFVLGVEVAHRELQRAEDVLRRAASVAVQQHAPISAKRDAQRRRTIVMRWAGRLELVRGAARTAVALLQGVADLHERSRAHDRAPEGTTSASSSAARRAGSPGSGSLSPEPSSPGGPRRDAGERRARLRGRRLQFGRMRRGCVRGRMPSNVSRSHSGYSRSRAAPIRASSASRRARSALNAGAAFSRRRWFASARRIGSGGLPSSSSLGATGCLLVGCHTARGKCRDRIGRLRTHKAPAPYFRDAAPRAVCVTAEETTGTDRTRTLRSTPAVRTLSPAWGGS